VTRHQDALGFGFLGFCTGASVMAFGLTMLAQFGPDDRPPEKTASQACSTHPNQGYDSVFLASWEGQEGRINTIYGPFNLHDDDGFAVATAFMQLGDVPVVFCRNIPAKK
jgi:hypothetical protein